MSPLQRYRDDLLGSHLLPDEAQAVAIEHVDRLYHQLLAPPSRPTILSRLLRRPERPWIRGLYLWGRVGRGKTYIVDTFFEDLDIPLKRRTHFHSFMRQVHLDLKSLANEPDPLSIIGQRWSKKFRLLCLDEFHVGDITDAMILAKLLETLFAHGVTLVATSNEAPARLYQDGLQRERFLPAIALLEANLEVIELGGDVDYRLRALERAGVYYCPHGSETKTMITEQFDAITPSSSTQGGFLSIEGREIPTRRQGDGIVWFDFETLCAGARATSDYIEIALCHHTVVLSEIPVMDRDMSDAARRFINLIDEFYDRKVKLIISAAAPIEQLYTGTRLTQQFKRTASRLHEMQSHDYLALPHLAD